MSTALRGSGAAGCDGAGLDALATTFGGVCFGADCFADGFADAAFFGASLFDGLADLETEEDLAADLAGALDAVALDLEGFFTDDLATKPLAPFG